MSVDPTFGFTSFGSGPQTVELWIDTLCPFSSKAVAFFHSWLVPQVLAGGKYEGKLRILVRLYLQPWHPGTTFVTEGILATGRLLQEHGHDNQIWLDVVAKFFEEQLQFCDVPTKDMTPEAIKDSVAEFAASQLKEYPDLAQDITRRLRGDIAFKDNGRGGTPQSMDLKYFIKLGRQNSVHVTPSFMFNGLLEGGISSSWGVEEWTQFFESKHL